jgi:acetolactate synthase I/II/III large subunit
VRVFVLEAHNKHKKPALHKGCGLFFYGVEKMNGAEALLHALAEQDVDTLFGYPGGAIMPIYDAFYHNSNIHHVLVRHEQGAVHAAEGYARANHKPGVCMATSGPGATNLITGITDAMLDSVPIVCITGQVASHLLGTDAFQEADIIGMTIPITKWSYQITEANEIPRIIAKAFDIAQNGRPGPVLIDITKDAQVNTLDESQASSRFTPHYKPPLLDMLQVKKAARLINQAKKPYLLVGHGVLISSAEAVVLELARIADIPIASTLLGLSAIPTQDPLYVGMLGMHGNYSANLLTNEADVIIAVGMRFDDRVTGNVARYAPEATIIHIDIDAVEINKIIKSTVALRADATQAFNALLPHIVQNQHIAWRKAFSHCQQQEFQQVIQHEIAPPNGDIKMAEVIHCLSKKTDGNALIVTDVGQHQMIAARYYQFKQSNSHITSGGLGTMGFALPAAIGAQLAQPNRLTIAIAGDGGFQMNIQELAVLTQEKLPVKMIILNNHYLGMVRQWQELFFEERYSFTEMQSPDFSAVAKAYGIASHCVKCRQDLSAALDTLLTHDGPYLLDIHVKKEENVFPMIPSGAAVTDVRLT